MPIKLHHALSDNKITEARTIKRKECQAYNAVIQARIAAGETDLKLRVEDVYTLHDGDGLFLDVDHRKRKGDTHIWRAYVYINDKRSKETYGSYPTVSVKRARELLQASLKAIADQKQGEQITPSVLRRQEQRIKAKEALRDEETARRLAAGEVPADCFWDIAMQVWEHDTKLVWKTNKRGKNVTSDKFMAVMERFVRGVPDEDGVVPHYFDLKMFPEIGERDIEAMKQRVLTEDTKNQSQDNKTVMAQAVRFVKSVFERALGMKLIDKLPAFTPPRQNDAIVQKADDSEKHPGVTDEANLGRLLRSIMAEKSERRFDGRDALMAVMLSAQRRAVILDMEWVEIHWDTLEWVIPKDKMKKCGRVKMKNDFVVPLSTHLRDLLWLRWQAREMGSRKSRFVFPSRSLKNDHDHLDQKSGKTVPARGQSETLMQEILNDNNWADIHTTHGSRTTFRTMSVAKFGDTLTINGVSRNVHILGEIQLAHTHGKLMKEMTANMPGKYNEHDAVEERRVLMQMWADYVIQVWQTAPAEEIGYMRERAEEAASLAAPAPLKLAA
jgi:integrase